MAIYKLPRPIITYENTIPIRNDKAIHLRPSSGEYNAVIKKLCARCTDKKFGCIEFDDEILCFDLDMHRVFGTQNRR